MGVAGNISSFPYFPLAFDFGYMQLSVGNADMSRFVMLIIYLIKCTPLKHDVIALISGPL